MPGRHLSHLERRLKEWWDAYSGPSLRTIEIKGGAWLRGLFDFTIDFRYPFVVLAKNGTGKSTILACAACAYQNRGTYSLWLQRGKYFRFTDFFVTTPQDPPLVNVQVQWTYRKKDRTVELHAITKGASRWYGYEKRPDRVVEFIGLIRTLHPTELRALRNHFGTRGTSVLQSLESTHKDTVSRVINRTYEDIQVAVSGRHSLHFLHADGICYSGFNMGSGEDVICELAEIIASDEEWLEKRLITLPGAVAPEVYLQRGVEETGYRETAAQYLNADTSVLNDFFAAPPSPDHHNLCYGLGLCVGLDPSRVEIALCKGAAECQPSDFEPLRNFLNERLAAED